MRATGQSSWRSSRTSSVTCASTGALDRRAGDLAVALAQRGRRRPRRARRRPGSAGTASSPATSSLQSMLPPQRPRRDRRVTPGSAGGIPSTPRNGASSTVRPERAADAAVQLPVAALSSPPNVVPQAPGCTSSMRTASVCPCRAPRTSIGPASAWPVVDSDSAASSRSPRATYQPAFGVEKRTESPGSTVEHRRQLAREVPVERPRSSGSSCIATRTRAACAPRPRRARPRACTRPRSASTGTARRSR